MSCSSCSVPTSRMQGHFGRVNAYVKASPGQIFTNTGPVISAPNETAGMHVNRITPALRGLRGDIFGAGQTNWISGIPNEYVVGGGVLILAVMMMR